MIVSCSGTSRRAVVAPVEERVDDDGLRRRAARCRRCSAGRVAEVVAEARLRPSRPRRRSPWRTGRAAAWPGCTADPWPGPTGRGPGSRSAARADVGQVAVPAVAVDLGQRDRGPRRATVRLRRRTGTARRRRRRWRTARSWCPSRRRWRRAGTGCRPTPAVCTAGRLGSGHVHELSDAEGERNTLSGKNRRRPPCGDHGPDAGCPTGAGQAAVRRPGGAVVWMVPSGSVRVSSRLGPSSMIQPSWWILA